MLCSFSFQLLLFTVSLIYRSYYNYELSHVHREAECNSQVQLDSVPNAQRVCLRKAEKRASHARFFPINLSPVLSPICKENRSPVFLSLFLYCV
jgi:hypothetical protein